MIIKDYKGVDIRFVIVLILFIIFSLGIMAGVFIEDYLRWQDAIQLKCETLENNRA